MPKIKEPKEVCSYTHQAESDQEPDTRPGPYYVSIVDGAKKSLVSGPYEKHQQALDAVGPVRTIVARHDYRSHWYGFGTARLQDPADAKPGVLQKLGYPLINGGEPVPEIPEKLRDS